MNFLFIINNIILEDKVIKPKEIINALYKNKVWIFPSSAPHKKTISAGDGVILYIAGKENRYFHSTFEISSKVKEIDNVNALGNFKEFETPKFFKYYISIKNISVFDMPVFIKEIKDKLSFITDKKNYGLFLRQSVRVIPENDYLYILKSGESG